MRKLIFLILITLFAAYAGWAERRPVGHYLSDLRSQVSVVQASPASAATCWRSSRNCSRRTTRAPNGCS